MPVESNELADLSRKIWETVCDRDIHESDIVHFISKLNIFQDEALEVEASIRDFTKNRQIATGLRAMLSPAAVDTYDLAVRRLTDFLDGLEAEPPYLGLVVYIRDLAKDFGPEHAALEMAESVRRDYECLKKDVIESQSKLEEVSSESKAVKTKIDKLKNEVKNSQIQAVTVLGIFVTAVFAFVGGNTIISQLLTTISSGSLAWKLFDIGFITFMVFTILFVMLLMISKISDKQINTLCPHQYCQDSNKVVICGHCKYWSDKKSGYDLKRKEREDLKVFFAEDKRKRKEDRRIKREANRKPKIVQPDEQPEVQEAAQENAQEPEVHEAAQGSSQPVTQQTAVGISEQPALQSDTQPIEQTFMITNGTKSLNKSYTFRVLLCKLMRKYPYIVFPELLCIALMVIAFILFCLEKFTNYM